MEIKISPTTKIFKQGGYSCKVETGDIHHDGMVYKEMVRRITLVTPEGEELTHETKGSRCDVAARKWLSDKTNGTIATY